MILTREATRTIIHLPIGSMIALVICSVMLGLQIAGVGRETPMLVSASIFVLLTLGLVISHLHAVQRVDDELIMRWSFGTKRWLADEHVLRAVVRGTKTASLQLELVDRNAEFYAASVSIAVLEPNASGRARAQAIATLLGLPLTDEVPG